MLDWLRLEFGIEKPSQKLQDVARLDADGLAAEVKKARDRSKPLSVAEVRRLKAEHVTTVAPLQTQVGEAMIAPSYPLCPHQAKPIAGPSDRIDPTGRPGDALARPHVESSDPLAALPMWELRDPPRRPAFSEKGPA